MAIKRDDEVDFSKSTMKYPMDKEPVAVFVEPDVDYSKSTGRFPMYDDAAHAEQAADRAGVTIAAAATTATSTGAFPTPGPISAGVTEAVTKQRADLELSDDPTGASDAGYEARPSTVPVPGADGVDRDGVVDDATTKEQPVPDTTTPATTKTVKGARTKVVKPPPPATGTAKTTAEGK